MEEQNEKLFTGFPPVSTAEWEARIKEDLKGADYEKKLIWKSLDNIRVKPYLYCGGSCGPAISTPVAGAVPLSGGNKTTGNDWEIRQDFRVFDIDTTFRKPKWPLNVVSPP